MGEFRLKDYNVDDTICAIATYPAKCALGVIKISGKDAIDTVSKIFVPARKKNIKKAKTYTLHYGWIMERPKTSDMVDEVLVSIMRKPHSYTKEDVAEISCHGGTLVLNKILEIVLKEGVRLALPGEFTYRALLKGRLDLLRAQSILNLVEAKSEETLKLAARQLKGEVSQKIEALKIRIKSIFMQTEAQINFPEDDVKISRSNIKGKIRDIEGELIKLLEGARSAKILKEGVKCVICGKSNAGKSTLFNCLLREERVIVSKLPGTTRDVIEETINIKGVPLRIYDTAGILEPKDLVAKKAIEKTSRTFDEADLIILVLDASRPLDKDDLFLLETVKNKDTILVINKIDLKQRLKVNFPRFRDAGVYLSALKGRGIKDLEKAVFRNVYRGGLDRENVIFLNQFQREVLKNVKDSIVRAKNFLDNRYTVDFINLSLKESLDNLSKLTEGTMPEDILESIFSNFCIGK